MTTGLHPRAVSTTTGLDVDTVGTRLVSATSRTPRVRLSATRTFERPMRALFVINALAPGGAERQLVSLVTGLDRRRFRPEVAVLEPGGRLETELRAADVPVRAFPRTGRFAIGFLPALVRYARGGDLLHAWLTPGTLFGLLAGRLARVPVLVGSERGTTYVTRRALHASLLRAEASLLARTSGVVANTSAGAAYVRSRGVPRGKIRVVHNALPLGWPPAVRERDEMRRSLGVEAAAFVIVVGASLLPKKDHETLLRALEALSASGLRPTLLVAGDGPERERLERLAADLGIEEQVRFLGGRADVPDLLGASDLAVLASKEREGCSNFLMEAMALGVPVVTTETGGARELVDDERTGLVVPARDRIALAAAIRRMMRRPDIRRGLAAAAHEDVYRRFDGARMVEETETLYTEWLGRAGIPAGAGRRAALRVLPALPGDAHRATR